MQKKILEGMEKVNTECVWDEKTATLCMSLFFLVVHRTLSCCVLQYSMANSHLVIAAFHSKKTF